MKEKDHPWICLFLLSCAFWAATSGVISVNFEQYSNPQPTPTAETAKVSQLLAQK